MIKAYYFKFVKLVHPDRFRSIDLTKMEANMKSLQSLNSLYKRITNTSDNDARKETRTEPIELKFYLLNEEDNEKNKKDFITQKIENNSKESINEGLKYLFQKAGIIEIEKPKTVIPKNREESKLFNEEFKIFSSKPSTLYCKEMLKSKNLSFSSSLAKHQVKDFLHNSYSIRDYFLHLLEKVNLVVCTEYSCMNGILFIPFNFEINELVDFVESNLNSAIYVRNKMICEEMNKTS